MYEKLPSKLKENALLCLWQYEKRDGNLTKVQFQVNGSCADSTKKCTFTDSRLVANTASGYDKMTWACSAYSVPLTSTTVSQAAS